MLRTAPITSSQPPGWVTSNYLSRLLDDPLAVLPSQPWDTAIRSPPVEKRPAVPSAQGFVMSPTPEKPGSRIPTSVTSSKSVGSTSEALAQQHLQHRAGSQNNQLGHVSTPRCVMQPGAIVRPLEAAAGLLCYARPFEEPAPHLDKHAGEAGLQAPPSPESQHCEESQPTPQFVKPTPQFDLLDACLSLPTPQIEEDPTPCLSLPTPQLHEEKERAVKSRRKHHELYEPTPQLNAPC